MREERKPLGFWCFVSDGPALRGERGRAGTAWAAAASARLRCVGWEQGLRLEVAEIGLDLLLGGRRELLWHVGRAGLGKVGNVQEVQVDLSAQSRVS